MPVFNSPQPVDAPEESSPPAAYAGDDEALHSEHAANIGFGENALLAWATDNPADAPRSGSFDDVRLAAGYRVQLYVVFFDKTVTVDLQHDEALVIGRADPGLALTPQIDLRAFNGVQFGVSRQHARLMLHSGTVHVMDIGSTNGTFVNGVRLVPFRAQPLYSGDELALGQFKIKATCTRRARDHEPPALAGSANE